MCVFTHTRTHARTHTHTHAYTHTHTHARTHSCKLTNISKHSGEVDQNVRVALLYTVASESVHEQPDQRRASCIMAIAIITARSKAVRCVGCGTSRNGGNRAVRIEIQGLPLTDVMMEICGRTNTHSTQHTQYSPQKFDPLYTIQRASQCSCPHTASRCIDDCTHHAGSPVYSLLPLHSVCAGRGRISSALNIIFCYSACTNKKKMFKFQIARCKRSLLCTTCTCFEVVLHSLGRC